MTITHGFARRGPKIRLYHVWESMKKRCKNPNDPRWELYGGKGIKVCSEWLDFSKFYGWAINHGYNDSLQIDRTDNNKDYCPDNCRFVTIQQNCQNRTTTKLTEEKVIIARYKYYVLGEKLSDIEPSKYLRDTVGEAIRGRTWSNLPMDIEQLTAVYIRYVK